MLGIKQPKRIALELLTIIIGGGFLGFIIIVAIVATYIEFLG